MDICPKCGLPIQACVCENIAKSEQRIQVTTVKRKFGKITTVVSGFDKSIDIQGDHRRKIKLLLVELGFNEDSIASE